MINNFFHSIKYKSDLLERISNYNVRSDFKIKSIRVVVDKALPVDEKYFKIFWGKLQNQRFITLLLSSLIQKKI